MKFGSLFPSLRLHMVWPQRWIVYFDASVWSCFQAGSLFPIPTRICPMSGNGSDWMGCSSSQTFSFWTCCRIFTEFIRTLGLLFYPESICICGSHHVVIIFLLAASVPLSWTHFLLAMAFWDGVVQQSESGTSLSLWLRMSYAPICVFLLYSCYPQSTPRDD